MSVRKETIMNVIVTMSKCPLTTLKVGGGGGPGGGGGGGGIGILTLVGNVQDGLVTGDLADSTGATNTKTPAKQTHLNERENSKTSVSRSGSSINF